MIYRGSRDGLNRKAWHSKCDNITNTVTVILSNFNYVFGGYTSVGFTSVNTTRYVNDTSAYIFSLRQGSIATNGSKYTVFDSSAALFLTVSLYGPAFGRYSGSYYCDIANGLDSAAFFTDFGASYNLPSGYTYGTNETRSFLAGSFSYWTTTEMEVYKIN